jgi:hypothetical protein
MRVNVLVTLLFLTSPAATQAQSIIVDAFTDCWVTMISDEEESPQHGWWGIWHNVKAEQRYHHTPHVFSDLEPGSYTLVVYNPASADFDPNSGIIGERSDGLSLEYLEVEDKEGEVLELYFKRSDFKAWNCLSCPWLYVHDGQRYARQTEVLKDVVGFANQTATAVGLSPDLVVDGKIRVRLQEEKDEITYLDRCILKVGQASLAAEAAPAAASRKLAYADLDYVILKKGDSIDLEFTLPPGTPPGAEIVLETSGYYEPDSRFLQSVRSFYLRKREPGECDRSSGLAVSQGPSCPVVPRRLERADGRTGAR